MTTYIIAYLATLVFFLVVDMVWLAGIAKKIYGRQLGSLMTRNIRWGAAGVFYALYILGAVIFAIRPAVEAQSLMTGLTLGALYGFFCYMTYDLTNLATLKRMARETDLDRYSVGNRFDGQCSFVRHMGGDVLCGLIPTSLLAGLTK